jgi:hypothetical protein
LLRIAACEESFDDIFLDAAPEPAARPQLGRMPGGACKHPCMRRATHSYREKEYSERRHYRAAL